MGVCAGRVCRAQCAGVGQREGLEGRLEGGGVLLSAVGLEFLVSASLAVLEHNGSVPAGCLVQVPEPALCAGGPPQAEAQAAGALRAAR